MLVFVTLFLISLLISATAIWLYRMVSNLRDSKYQRATRPGTKPRVMLKAQQGLVSLITPTLKNKKHRALRSPKGGIKAPWGW